MPMDKARYPKDWPAISRRIRERAGNCCEWCGVANGAVGARDCNGEWHNADDIDHLNSDMGYALFGEYPKLIRIILTVAHLGAPHADGRGGDKHDKMDVRDENLASLCQRCHLNYDREDHIRNAARTRQRKAREAVLETGQLELL